MRYLGRCLCGLTAVLVWSGPARAADWLSLLGAEPKGSTVAARPWGYGQAQYQRDFSRPNGAGQYVPPKVIGPDLEQRAAFNITGAAIGLRGTPFGWVDRVNYSLLLELGNNAATNPGDTLAQPLDASLTLHLPAGPKLRLGLFKYPGAEEGLQALMVSDYINLSEAVNGLLLERLPNPRYSANLPAQTLPPALGLNGFDRHAATFRDVGAQWFDGFERAGWQHSYAAMLGNGNGLSFDDPDGAKDLYLYWASEQVHAGQGPRREGLKLFAWGQWGERRLDHSDDGVANPRAYDRNRLGLGLKYLRLPYRLTFEYVDARGMIFVGPDKPSFTFTVPANGNGADARGHGGYLEAGWYLPGTKWELDARYDSMTRLLDRPDQHRLSKWTLGVQYHFDPRTRLTLNYELRDFTCDSGQPGCVGPESNLKDVGDKVGIQVTTVF